MAAAIDGRGERALQLLLLLALVLGAAGACDCDFANGPPAVVRCVQPQTPVWQVSQTSESAIYS